MDSFSNSQLTFVAPEPPLELVLETRPRVLNTRLLLNGRPRYRISTLDRGGQLTEVTDLDTNEIIATIRRRMLLADQVQFPRRFGGKPVKKDDWMVAKKRKNGQPYWVINSEKGRFVWRLDPVLRMVLTPENSPDDMLAYVVNEPPVFAWVVKRGAEGSLDEIIPALALIEQWMRLEACKGQATNGAASAGGG